MSDRIQRFPLRLLAWLGVAAIVIGFLWGAIKVGVPYQDPTPEMAAHERFHMGVADLLMGAGSVLVIVSGAFAVVRRLTRRSGA